MSAAEANKLESGTALGLGCNRLLYGSLFAGCGGFDVGFDNAGMTCSWQVEIDEYRRKILNKHWPDATQWGDIRTFKPTPVDVICGGSPAKTSATLENAKGLTESVADSGESSTESFAKYSHGMWSLKTSQRSLFGDSAEFSETWPTAGTMRSGKCYQRPLLVHTTKEKESSLWPTARASMGTHGVCWKRARNGEHKSNLEDFVAWLMLRNGGKETSGLNMNPDWVEWWMGFPIGHTDLNL